MSEELTAYERVRRTGRTVAKSFVCSCGTLGIYRLVNEKGQWEAWCKDCFDEAVKIEEIVTSAQREGDTADVH